VIVKKAAANNAYRFRRGLQLILNTPNHVLAHHASSSLQDPALNNQENNIMQVLSADCRHAVDLINRQAEEKVEQLRKARERNSSELDELRELYPNARDAWNQKAALIKKNGPGYSAGFGPLYGDGSKFTLADLDLGTIRFFALLAEAAYPSVPGGRGRDIVRDVADRWRGLMMPSVSSLLDRLHNQCRDEHDAVMAALDPKRLPELFDEF